MSPIPTRAGSGGFPTANRAGNRGPKPVLKAARGSFGCCSGGAGPVVSPPLYIGSPQEAHFIGRAERPCAASLLQVAGRSGIAALAQPVEHIIRNVLAARKFSKLNAFFQQFSWIVVV